MDTLVNPGESVDDLGNGYKIIQGASLFRFGQDAVLLSAFAKAKKGELVLDLCTGNGIVPILMCARYKHGVYEGLELLPESVVLAKRSVILNGLENKINITEGDVMGADRLYAPASFDVITANPPYMNKDGGIANPGMAEAIARHELKMTLEGLIAASSKLLRFGGRFYMVHRPRRLADIFYYMRAYKIEPKTLRLVCPKAGRAPDLALISGTRGANSFLRVLPELVIYNADGSYTDEVRKIYYG